MTDTDLIVSKADLGSTQLIANTASEAELGDGQILVAVDRFALTSNNLSYAGAGERMGYWNFFPAPDPAWGRIPVWGYATVEASEHPDMAVGEQLFGLLPMSSRLVMTPEDVTEPVFHDRTEHRRDLHPWYNRYYRTAHDPVSQAGHTDIQPVLWALYMTGWMLAAEIEADNGFGAEIVVIASASSKTASSLAHSLAARDTGVEIVGLTSARNAPFVTGLGCYDTVLTYDTLLAGDGLPADRQAVFVDLSGNAEVVMAVHTGFGDRLVESIRVGGTHLGKRGDGAPLPGVAPRFFFIPDVAEAEAERVGFEQYHATFAEAWRTFAPWAAGFTTLRHETGPDAIRRAYLDALGGSHDPTTGIILDLGD